MNVLEKQSILQSAVEEAEKQLGRFCASDGASLTDHYAQTQIKYIFYLNEMLLDLCESEVDVDNED